MEDNPLKDKKIEFASQDSISAFSNEIEEIFKVFDIEYLFISDESMVADFCLDEEELKSASEKLGIDIKNSDHIVEVAARLFASRNK